ncbi:46124_t:CDS:2, partial [Gigaspora margarita]
EFKLHPPYHGGKFYQKDLNTWYEIEEMLVESWKETGGEFADYQGKDYQKIQQAIEKLGGKLYKDRDRKYNKKGKNGVKPSFTVDGDVFSKNESEKVEKDGKREYEYICNSCSGCSGNGHSSVLKDGEPTEGILFHLKEHRKSCQICRDKYEKDQENLPKKSQKQNLLNNCSQCEQEYLEAQRIVQQEPDK